MISLETLLGPEVLQTDIGRIMTKSSPNPRTPPMPINKEKMESLKRQYGTKKGEEIYYKMEQKEKGMKRNYGKAEERATGKATARKKTGKASPRKAGVAQTRKTGAATQRKKTGKAEKRRSR